MADPTPLAEARRARARILAAAGGLDAALASGVLPRRVDMTVSEALVLGLLRQGVSKFLVVLGHGSTEVGEVLRLYAEAGLVRVFAMRSEVSASHAAAALRWTTGEKAAVVTSIGPGALQAGAASLVASSDGLGVWYLVGDETTEDEGYNMQQVPRPGQHQFLRVFETLGSAYTLHTPGALPTALRRGLNAVDRPYRAGPFFLLMPMNVQGASVAGFNLDELPAGAPPRLAAARDDGAYDRAVDTILAARRVVVRVGGGARDAGFEIEDFVGLADAVAITSPLVSGVLPYHHPRNLGVAGSKGSSCGNFAQENADLVVVVGSRSVCQSDSSRTAYRPSLGFVAINADPDDALHYGRTIPLVGDAASTLRVLNKRLLTRLQATPRPPGRSAWLAECTEAKAAWEAFKAERYAKATLHDDLWGGPVLTQPAALKVATDWARANDVVSFFDAGDVQANGFQVVEDDRIGRTYTDTGASYMGFAASALTATGIAGRPFYGLALTGDGSFMMNPQVLIEGVEHGARGCILLLDNRRMAAISSLQQAQYGHDFATWDRVAVDYVALAGAVSGVLAIDGGRTPESLREALARARAHDGLSLVYAPVYAGTDPLGGLGAFGRWNVGGWCADVQALRHEIGL